MFERICHWMRSRPITVVMSVILFAFFISYLSRESNWAFRYLRAASQMHHGEDIYRKEFGFAYPPCRALMMMPFLGIPDGLQVPLWWACNAVCLMLICRWTWRLAGGSSLEPLNRFTQVHYLWLAGVTTGIFYAFNSLSHQSTDLVETMFLIAGCVLLTSSRPLCASTCLGLAAGMKATPLLWCVYLLWKREYIAAAWLLTVALGINLLPDLVSQCPTSATWLGGWCQSYVNQLFDTTVSPGHWGSVVYNNQSLAGMVNRLFHSDWSLMNNHFEVFTLPATGSMLYYKLGLLVTEACTLLGCLKLISRTRSTSNLEQALEYSIVVMLMLLFSPMSSKSHFTMLLLPGMILARVSWIAWQQQRYLVGSLFIVANVLGLFALNWWDKNVTLVSLYYGAVSNKTLLMLVACCVALPYIRKRDAVTECICEPERQLLLAA